MAEAGDFAPNSPLFVFSVRVGAQHAAPLCVPLGSRILRPQRIAEHQNTRSYRATELDDTRKRSARYDDDQQAWV